MIIYGFRTQDHGSYEIQPGAVPESSDGEKLSVSIFQKLITIFFIPILPLGKEAIVNKLAKTESGDEKWVKIKKKSQSSELKEKIKLLKKTKKTPVWAWAGSALLAVVAVIFIAITAFGPTAEERLTEGLKSLGAGSYIVVNETLIYEDVTDDMREYPYSIFRIDSDQFEGEYVFSLNAYSYEYASDAKNDRSEWIFLTEEQTEGLIYIEHADIESWIEIDALEYVIND